MRWRRTAELTHLDLGALLRLAPAAAATWRALRFGPDGRLVHGTSGAPVEAVRLTAGAHGQAGARYLIDLDALLPAAPTAEGDDSPPRGRVVWTALPGDAGDRVRGRLGDEQDRWSVDLDLQASGPPTAVAAATASLTALAGGDAPGCLADRIAGDGRADARLDVGPLRSGEGRAVEVTATMRSAAVVGHVDVRTTLTTWRFELDGSLKGRGILGRLGLLIVGARLQRRFDERLDDALAAAPDQLRALEAQLDDLDHRIDEARGERPFVEHHLWRALDPG